MKANRVASLLTLLLVATLLAVPGLVTAQGPGIPETDGAIDLPAPTGPFSEAAPRTNGGLLYLTSIDCYTGAFARYDPGTDSWTTLNDYYTHAQMAVSATGDLYALNCQTQDLELYDPVTDSWTYLMDGPPVNYSKGNLEIANNGEFLYVEADDPNLYYTSGASWTSMGLPFSPNSMGDYDPTTGQFVLGERSTTNAHLIDAFGSWSITDFYSSVPNGEWARFGSILDDRYFFEAGGSNIHSFDLSSPGAPLDHGVSPGWYNSSAADRGNHVIYTATLDGAQLLVFDPATNGLTALTGYMNIGNHSSLAFTASAGMQNEMHVEDMAGFFSLDYLGRPVLRAFVLVADDGPDPLGDVLVDVSIWYPGGGPVQRARYTKPTGWARFHWGSVYGGTWTLCVDDLTLAGYVYNPDDNVVTCQDWYY